jgi:hypothetical protein
MGSAYRYDKHDWSHQDMLTCSATRAGPLFPATPPIESLKGTPNYPKDKDEMAAYKLMEETIEVLNTALAIHHRVRAWAQSHCALPTAAASRFAGLSHLAPTVASCSPLELAATVRVLTPRSSDGAHPQEQGCLEPGVEPVAKTARLRGAGGIGGDGDAAAVGVTPVVHADETMREETEVKGRWRIFGSVRDGNADDTVVLFKRAQNGEETVCAEMPVHMHENTDFGKVSEAVRVGQARQMSDSATAVPVVCVGVRLCRLSSGMAVNVGQRSM